MRRLARRRRPLVSVSTSAVPCRDVRVVGLLNRSPAAAWWVDPKVHTAEVERFRSKIVTGSGDEDCSTWIGSLGADGYGRYYITREGMGFCVRPNRYALALESGEVLSADVFALHECDIPVCVKVNPSECLRQHVVAGAQHENMRRMGRARRGGGHPTIRGLGREARRAFGGSA